MTTPSKHLSFQEQSHTMALYLFDQFQRSNNHLLWNLLPPPSTSSQNYNLRTRSQSQQLLQRTGHLTDSSFFLQECFSMTFINVYHINFHRFYLSPIKLHVFSFLLNEYWIGLEVCTTIHWSFWQYKITWIKYAPANTYIVQCYL